MSRSEEIAQERLSSWEDNGKACIGCRFADGSTPFSDDPSKGSCEVFQYPKTKPDSVYIDGCKCKYYREGGSNDDR